MGGACGSTPRPNGETFPRTEVESDRIPLHHQKEDSRAELQESNAKKDTAPPDKKGEVMLHIPWYRMVLICGHPTGRASGSKMLCRNPIGKCQKHRKHRGKRSSANKRKGEQSVEQPSTATEAVRAATALDAFFSGQPCPACVPTAPNGIPAPALPARSRPIPSSSTPEIPRPATSSTRAPCETEAHSQLDILDRTATPPPVMDTPPLSATADRASSISLATSPSALASPHNTSPLPRISPSVGLDPLPQPLSPSSRAKLPPLSSRPLSSPNVLPPLHDSSALIDAASSVPNG